MLLRPEGQVENFAISPRLIYDPWLFGERPAFYNRFREGDRRQAKTLFHQANLTYLRVLENNSVGKFVGKFGSFTESWR